MTKTPSPNIESVLKNHHAFLAYMAANALLHDADKMTPEFLRWSLGGGGKPTEDYASGHNRVPEKREPFRAEKMASLLPDLDPLQIELPVRCVAVELGTLRKELTADRLYSRRENGNFLQWLKENQNEKLAGELGTNPSKFNFSRDYTSLLTNTALADLKAEVDALLTEHWQQVARSGQGLYDFYGWHHNPTLQLKTDHAVPSSLQLFSAGTAGIDGQDTLYETEREGCDAAEHHVPDTLKENKLLIATPFGHEREVSLNEATCTASKLQLAVKVRSLHSDLADGHDPMANLDALRRAVRKVFDQTTIRTGRPLNDITLADHSLSTAALALAHGARVILESVGSPENGCYALPLRGKFLDSSPPWPKSSFALFSCAVNAGYLDDMAMDLKDITAIRAGVSAIFDGIEKTFQREFPVGGSVYRDQHGVHLVVPVLGEPSRRWVAEKNADNGVDPVWTNAEGSAISNRDFQDWLFAKAKAALLAEKLPFGRELAIGLRHAVIGEELNRLAEAIRWSRQISGFGAIGANLPNSSGTDSTAYFKFPSADSGAEKLGELCKVCRLRIVPPCYPSDLPRRDRGKCQPCIDRVNKYSSDKDRETTDLETMNKSASDGRLALVSLAFQLDEWLGSPVNQGIFCYGNGTKKFPKDVESQRLNSFGRLRRIWRSSEDFLYRMREKARELCAIDDGRVAMRTIMRQPQDLQIILPARFVGHFLDHIVEHFFLEFGRPAGRVPFHVSSLIFYYLTPIYLVLEAARRQRHACLTTHPDPVDIVGFDKDNGMLNCNWGRDLSHLLPVPFRQGNQPHACLMKGSDQFHANLQLPDGSNPGWRFAGDFSNSSGQKALLVVNRLSLAEIGGGGILNELSVLSKQLPVSRIHDLPLACWGQIRRLLALESRLSSSQVRSLRGILARRERTWPEKGGFYREACELLWREPGRFGPKKWSLLDESDRELLVRSCVNGLVFLAGTVDKRFVE